MTRPWSMLLVLVSFLWAGSPAAHAEKIKENSGPCAKLTCGQFKTCQEALVLASKCPGKVKQLDRDGDGMPCDNVCSKKKPGKKK